MKPSNLDGRRFGKLVVIHRVENYVKPNGKKESKWLCQCDCGKTTKVVSSHLKSGMTKSCGCLIGKAFNDLTGKRFGSLTVTERSENMGKRTAWLCKCDCGNTCHAPAYRLNSGQMRSCGCLRRELAISVNTTHGMSHTRLYKVWGAMKRRCDCPTVDRYPVYGGRGISYCEEWTTFEPFMRWALATGYSQGLSIDRIDVNGNYEPDNCRWVLLEEQSLNKVNSKNVRLGDETKPLKEWCILKNIPYEKAYQRLYKLGWSPEKTFTA